MTPLLSIIVPFYNGKKYVKNIEKAFLAQSVKDFELICVDDGSTDGTAEALDELARSKDLNVKVVHQENGGVSSARNKGLELASGQFISFVDSDDFVASDYVELLDNNKSTKFDILVFQLKKVHEKDEKVADTTDASCTSCGNIALMTDFAKYPTTYGSCNMFISREFYDKYQFKFREGYKYYEDYEFIYRVFCLSRDILITQHQIYFYVLRKGSAMQSFNVDRYTCVKILEDLRPFFKEKAPEFLGVYDIWCVSRIYWSIMWQTCLAFTYKDAIKFAELVDIKTKVKPLLGVNNKKEKYSTWLLMNCTPLYVLVVKVLGRGRSAIKHCGNFSDFEKVLNESIDYNSSL